MSESNNSSTCFVPKDQHPDDLHTWDRLSQYEYYFDYYQQKYGDKTTVLYQCGGFYEFYGVDNDQMKIGCVKEMCALLPMRMTCQDKTKPNRNTRMNYLLAGFPTVAAPKYIDFLIDHNYLVVVVDQIGTASDKAKPSEKLPHYVKEIYSPGTYVSPDSLLDEQDHKYLVQIFLHGYRTKPRAAFIDQNTSTNPTYQPMSVGLSAIDVTTGDSNFTEVTNSPEDANFGLDEIYRYLQTHQPREVLIASENLTMSPEELESYLDLRQNCALRCQINHNQVPKAYFNPRVQRQFLEGLFPNRRNLDVFEYLDLERAETALISYLLLLQYAYEHNETLVRNLAKPELWTGETHLLLANNAINQLDLVSTNRFKWGSVFNLINQTTTNMGKRLLKYRLLNPIRDPNEINQRYDFIDLFLEDNLWQDVAIQLTGILDLDRLHRRIELGILEPSGFNLLYDSYERIRELLELLPPSLFPTDCFLEDYQAYLTHLSTTLDFAETQKYVKIDQITDNIFCAGYYQELDELSDIIREHHRYLDVIEKFVSNLIPNSNRKPVASRSKKKKKESKTIKPSMNPGQSQGASRLNKKQDERFGYYFTITCNRFRMLQRELEQNPLNFKVGSREFWITAETFEILNTNRTESHHQITSPEIREISEVLMEHENRMKKMIPQIYLEYLKDLEQAYSFFYNQISQVVALADVYKSCAQTSSKYHYCRPEVVIGSLNSLDAPAPDSKSFLRATNFRHPIIERLNTKVPYVPHSVQFGELPIDLKEKLEIQKEKQDEESDENSEPSDSDDLPTNLFPEVHGMLVYGSNAVGKSSIMKAVGVNLILAQAGFHVAADRFQFAPYHRVLTRILGNDNLFKGQSSFAVEMSELRGILARADAHSLVLGDEICHGTETISGVAIVAAAIKRLSQTKSHFLFATHLHQLPKLDPIQELTANGQLGIYHLRVKYNAQTHELQYYRDLRTGSGDPIYGIEVARAMDLDAEFIKDAHQIRQTLMNQSPQAVAWDHPSRYNRQLLLDQCGVCQEEKATETHHIRFQSEADEKGFIGAMHKNRLCNLVGLCEQCHLKVHHGQLEIRGYLETSEGIKLDYLEGVKEESMKGNNKPKKGEGNEQILQVKKKKSPTRKLLSISPTSSPTLSPPTLVPTTLKKIEGI